MTDLVSTSSEGDTLDAIRARHAGRHVCGGSDGHVAIYEDGRCDTAIVLAALDRQVQAAYIIEDNRVAAIKREARLRAAAKEYQNAVEPWLYGYPLTNGEERMVWDRIKEAQAALSATEADHEHHWVDAPDDETGWHCASCGVTEYPATTPEGES